MHPPCIRADENGQGLVEYALIMVFIAVVVLVAVGFFGTELADTYTEIIDELRAIM